MTCWTFAGTKVCGLRSAVVAEDRSFDLIPRETLLTDGAASAVDGVVSTFEAEFPDGWRAAEGASAVVLLLLLLLVLLVLLLLTLLLLRYLVLMLLDLVCIWVGLAGLHAARAVRALGYTTTKPSLLVLSSRPTMPEWMMRASAGSRGA